MEQDEESEDDEEEEEDEDDGLEILMNAPQRSMDFRQVSQSSSPLDLTAFRSGVARACDLEEHSLIGIDDFPHSLWTII